MEICEFFHAVGDKEVVILQLKGKFAMANREEVVGGDELLKRKLNSLTQQAREPVHVLVDFQFCSYMDSAALGEIIRGYGQLSRLGGNIKLLNLPRRIKDLLAITKLDSIYEIFDNQADALKSFA